MTEQLALHEVLAQGAAIDSDEVSRALRERMDRGARTSLPVPVAPTSTIGTFDAAMRASSASCCASRGTRVVALLVAAGSPPTSTASSAPTGVGRAGSMAKTV